MYSPLFCYMYKNNTQYTHINRHIAALPIWSEDVDTCSQLIVGCVYNTHFICKTNEKKINKKKVSHIFLKSKSYTKSVPFSTKIFITKFIVSITN